MNWTKFQTYGMAPDKAFEVLCNQLFENWCKDEYGSDVASFVVVNGSGGDGGVESYAELKNGDTVGLQAKWFPTSISSAQIGQIKSSIKTAKKVRPAIKRYIICVPRDLASTTARTGDTGTTESNRWDDFVEDTKTNYPDVIVDLWNETQLATKLQKPACAGIYRFWFDNAEICADSVKYAFEKAKNGWMKTKYVPELNAYGKIENTISVFLGEEPQRKLQREKFVSISKWCNKYLEAEMALMAVCTEADAEIVEVLNGMRQKIAALAEVTDEIAAWYLCEKEFSQETNEEVFHIDFESLTEQIRKSNLSFTHHFHTYEVTKALRKLSSFDFYDLLRTFSSGISKESILFLGGPGTGKTHGLGAVADKLLSTGIHIPLIIQARSVSPQCTWRDIVSSNLGLSASWGEEDIWQALGSLANRQKFLPTNIQFGLSTLPKVVVMVDGIDEAAPHEKWVERIRETKVIVARYPWIRFCFTSRPTAMPRPYNYAETVRINGGDISARHLFDQYMQAYNIIAKNRGWLQSAITTPLALKLFCELNQGKTVDIKDRAEVAITTLWRRKVGLIEAEYCEKCGDSIQNQNILKAIVKLSDIFICNAQVERSLIIAEIQKHLGLAGQKAEGILQHLENYGVVSSICEWGAGFSPNKYYYIPGIQGCFDYAAATILLDEYGHPQDIDFEKYSGLDNNMLNGLAVLAIQKHGYLITRNNTIDLVLKYEDQIQDLQFLALQHTNYDNAKQFVARSKEIMSSNAEGLITIVNKLILPLSHDVDHPLGVSLLDSFLNDFEKPAQRDILWSTPAWLRDSYGKRWHHAENIELAEDRYLLEADDYHTGLPTVYAWSLSVTNNTLRKLYRDRLMVWARTSPEEFFSLFIKFAYVNDPQIRSEMYAILMCLIHDVDKKDLLLRTASWIMENVLHPKKVDANRDISVRYYAVAILRKAIYDGVIDSADATAYLPPYHAKNNQIALCKEALAGTRMGGYGIIDYDLSRYVLIDHLDSRFTSYRGVAKGQIDKLIKAIAAEQPGYEGMSMSQFVLSAAYAYLLNAGWNKADFCNHTHNEAGENVVEGVDVSIRRTYSSATHGSKSSVMTVAEKYVWQARNEISGFFCDRLLYGDDAEEITDYGMLDDFVVPAHELTVIDPNNIPEDKPWHIPDPSSVILDGNNESREDVVNNVLHAPVVPWDQWICVDNSEGKYKVSSKSLYMLHMYSCFYGSAGVETNIFVDAIIVKSSDVETFVEMLGDKGKENDRLANPTDWNGGIDASCYITPKEICCFPWKTGYSSSNVEEFPNVDISCAVDECCCNIEEYGDVFYYLPSAELRKKLGIADTDGYLYTDTESKVVAEYTLAGEKWRTYQSCLLLDRNLAAEQLSKDGKSLVWIMRERRSSSGLTSEKYGKFGADRFKSYVGYFKGESFEMREIRSSFQSYLPIIK